MSHSNKASGARKSAKTKDARPAPITNLTDDFVVRRWRDDSEAKDLLGIDFCRTGDRKTMSVYLEMAALGQPSYVAAELLNRGATLPTEKHVRDKVVASLLSCIPDHAGTLASRSGWHGSSFLLSGRARYGADDDTLRMKQSIIMSAPHLSQGKGGLSAWRKHVASPAKGSNALSYALMASLAAPLTRFAKLDEGVVFNFCGPGSTGKTTALYAAQSVVGMPEKLPDWNLSERALYEIAAAHSDLPLALDDLERFRPDNGTLAASLSKRVHTLTSGQATRYAASVQLSLPRLEWQSWVISSSIRTLHEEFARSKAEPSLGDIVRWIDLPVLPADRGGIWDLLANDECGGISAQRSETFKSAAACFYGRPIRRWLRYLVSVHGQLSLVVGELIGRFTNHVCPAASDVERRIARKFGVVYAAGCIAISQHILPWTEEHCLAVCSTMYERSRILRQKATFDVNKANASLLQAVHDEQQFPVVPESQRPRFAAGANVIGFRQVRTNADIIFIAQGYLEALYGPAFSRFMGKLRLANGVIDGQGGKATSQVRVTVGDLSVKKRFLGIYIRQLIATTSNNDFETGT